jgi:hypothetical protein
MHRIPRHLPALMLTLPLLAFAELSAAAPIGPEEPQHVDVPLRSALPATSDVRSACSGIEAALQDELAYAWRQVQSAALVHVEFQLVGNRAQEVSANGGPRAYSRYVRSAVRALDCQAASGGAQTCSFNIRFVDPDERAAPGPVAMIKP